MFVAVGCDWTTLILNSRDAWCNGIYGVVQGTGAGARILHVHGSLEGLRVWLARSCIEGNIPKTVWTAFHADAKTLRMKTLCKAAGMRILKGGGLLPRGKIRDALRYELAILKEGNQG